MADENKRDTMNAAFEGHEEGTAYHEAGHAVMGCILGRTPQRVTIIPDGSGAVGKVESEADWPASAKRYLDASPEKQDYVKKRVLIELSGSIAHALHNPNREPDLGDAEDTRWARAMIIENVSWDDDHEGYLEQCREEAQSLLRQHWPWVEAVAQALIKHKTRDGEQLLALRVG
jgi:ATP-dependent Zn protease